MLLVTRQEEKRTGIVDEATKADNKHNRKSEL